MRLSRLTFIACACALLWTGLAVTSVAALATFQGTDAGAGPASPRPNSNAAAANFDAAAGVLGTVQLINFESAPLGPFASLGVGPGVTAVTQGAAAAEGGILNTTGDATLGYNITAGGTRYLGFWPVFDIGTARLLFNFATPINSFGSYLTGLGTASGNLFVVFNDGTNQSIPVAGAASGGAKFFGFVDPGAAIVQVGLELRNISVTRDIFSVDDVRFVAVPEPATAALATPLGLMACGAQRLRRRTVAGAA